MIYTALQLHFDQVRTGLGERAGRLGVESLAAIDMEILYAPSGNLLASRLKDNERLLAIDLKAAAWQTIRSHPMPHFFPNRRPELYTQK